MKKIDANHDYTKDPHDVRLARHRAIGPATSPGEAARTEAQLRQWVEEHEDEFRAWAGDSDEMVAQWQAMGSPTPTDVAGMLKLSQEVNEAVARVRSARGSRRAS